MIVIMMEDGGGRGCGIIGSVSGVYEDNEVAKGGRGAGTSPIIHYHPPPSTIFQYHQQPPSSNTTSHLLLPS
jgi:hypothetical protein